MAKKQMGKRVRAEELMVRQGLAPSVELARALIMEGRVSLTGRRVDKPSEMLAANTALYVKGELDKYVSRGAHKLKKALEVFEIDVEGRACIDVGASTGGFTDVMLRAGAEHVYAIDVGYNQLDYRLRVDERVTSMERTNARDMKIEMFERPVTFGATDVSFISLKLVLPAIRSVLQPDSTFVALIKPQFEAAAEDVGEKGVVRDRNVHVQVVRDMLDYVQQNGWTVLGLDFSPIRGPEGNIEFLLYLKNCPGEASWGDVQAEAVVGAAYDKFITTAENA